MHCPNELCEGRMNEMPPDSRGVGTDARMTPRRRKAYPSLHRPAIVHTEKGEGGERGTGTRKQRGPEGSSRRIRNFDQSRVTSTSQTGCWIRVLGRRRTPARHGAPRVQSQSGGGGRGGSPVSVHTGIWVSWMRALRQSPPSTSASYQDQGSIFQGEGLPVGREKGRREAVTRNPMDPSVPS